MDGVALGDGEVLGAQRVVGAQVGGFEGLGNMQAQGVGLAQADQAAECAFAVGGGGVDQDAGHALAVLARRLGVDALPDAGGRITAFQRKLAHQGMRERVQKHVEHPRKAVFGRFDAAGLAPAHMGVKKFVSGRAHRALVDPLGEAFFIELDKNPLASHFAGWNPGGRGARERRVLGGDVQFIRQFAAGVDAGETDQGGDFSQALHQNYLFDRAGVLLRYGHRAQTKFLAVQVGVVFGEDLPLRPFQVGFGVLRAAKGLAALVFLDGGEDALIGILAEAPKLADRAQEGNDALIGDVLEHAPVLLDQLQNHIGGNWNADGAERDREPGVGGAQQDGAHFQPAGFAVVIAQVRAAAAAVGHLLTVFHAKSFGEAALGVAVFAAHFQVTRFAGGAVLDQAQHGGIAGGIAMDEFDPGEIIQMAFFAGRQEARRDDLRVPGLVTTGMTVAGFIHAVEILVQLEQPGTEGGQDAAVWADHPARKRGNGNADKGGWIEWIGGCAAVRHERRGEQLFDRWQVKLHGLQQAALVDRMGVLRVDRPIIQTGDDHGELGQVDQGANAVGKHQLTGANFANTSFRGCGHGLFLLSSFFQAF